MISINWGYIDVLKLLLCRWIRGWLMLFSVLSLQKMICHSKCQEKIDYLLWSLVVSKLVLTDPPAMTPGIKKVSIGSSLDSHVKCVEDPGNVHCDHTAKQVGRTGHLVVTELAIWCNLSTSSLSSFPLFWQPSAVTIPIPQSFWAWTEHETQSQTFTTKLPRVRV